MVAEAPGPCPPPGLSPHPRKSQVQAGGRGGCRGRGNHRGKLPGSPVSACVRACVREAWCGHRHRQTGHKHREGGTVLSGLNLEQHSV